MMTKIELRRTWYQAHKWIGLILAALIIPLSLSGALLVWHEPLDRALNPQRYVVSGRSSLAPDAYVAAARGVLKADDRIATVTLPEHAGPVLVAVAPFHAPVRPGPPVRTIVYLDPPTARVLDVGSSATGVMRFIHVLHGSLQVPGVGRTIVGWIGVAMALSSFTGLWLWWPVTGSLARGLRWRRARDVETNLHYRLGFWIALPLFVLSVTGMWIAFPAVFGGRAVGLGRGGPAVPLAAPARPLDQVIAAARPMAAGAALRSIAWPTDRNRSWTLAFARPHQPPVSLEVADDTGLAGLPPARDDGGLARLMRRVHSGEGMSVVWQVVVFVTGIIPAVLAVTGILMWTRARRWRGRARGRRVAVRVV